MFKKNYYLNIIRQASILQRKIADNKRYTRLI